MADFLNDPIGSKYGCSYRYTTGALGTFGALLNGPVNPRKVKDPMPLDGANFMAIDPAFAPVVKIGSYIQLLTSYTYPTNKYVLGSGTEEITKDQVDFSKFKKVINFSSLGKFTITAIPKDQLLVSKNLVDTSDFPDGIGYIGITATNATVHVALTKDNVNWVKYDTENELLCERQDGEWVAQLWKDGVYSPYSISNGQILIPYSAYINKKSEFQIFYFYNSENPSDNSIINKSIEDLKGLVDENYNIICGSKYQSPFVSGIVTNFDWNIINSPKVTDYRAKVLTQ